MGTRTTTKPCATGSDRTPSQTRFARSNAPTRSTVWRRTLLVIALLAGAPLAADAQTADNVLLVVNDTSPASVEIGTAYAARRGAVHVVHIAMPVQDGIERATYVQRIEAPISKFLAENRLQDRVLYIVLTKGVPLRVSGTGGLQGTTASVDSELTLLYRRMLGQQLPIDGRIANPYYLADKPVGEAKPFTHFQFDIYLVTRLDGFTVQDVKNLIDRGSAPSRDGKIVLDQKATFVDRGGDQWLEEAAARLTTAGAGDRLILDATRVVAAPASPLIGYYSWGSNDPARKGRRSGLTFAPGAIGGTFVSTDGRTFSEPPDAWTPSGPDGGPTFAGSFQSLAGDLIRDGITGVSAHVAEPYLDATIRPQILLPAYLAGFNLAESFYLAMPFLSWQTVIVGDPLCSPFEVKAVPEDQLFKDLDAETELPALFSDRELTSLAAAGMNRDALKLELKADGRLDRGVTDGVESLLVRAATLEPRLAFRLGSYYETKGDTEHAIAQYRRAVDADPRNVLALNNLAFSLAETQHAPAEALPFAERAARLSSDANVLDTLGWVRHLLGQDQLAAPALERAASARSASAEILLHAAIVQAAIENLAHAKAELDAAVKLDPKLADRSDVKALRAKVGGSDSPGLEQ